MGNARNSHKDVARAGRVASVAESRTKPGPNAQDKQHAADMARINRLNDSKLK